MAPYLLTFHRLSRAEIRQVWAWPARSHQLWWLPADLRWGQLSAAAGVCPWCVAFVRPRLTFLCVFGCRGTLERLVTAFSDKVSIVSPLTLLTTVGEKTKLLEVGFPLIPIRFVGGEKTLMVVLLWSVMFSRSCALCCHPSSFPNFHLRETWKELMLTFIAA